MTRSREVLLRTIFAGSALLGLAGCTPRYPYGTVVEKTHHNAYSYMTFILAGKVLVPITHYVPEKWGLVVENCSEPVEKPKCTRDEVTVNKGDWERTNPGEYLDFRPRKQ